MNAKIVTLLAATLASASAVSAEESPSTSDLMELNILLNDVSSNLKDYLTLAITPGSVFSKDNMPAGLIDLGVALANATDDSYTSLYKNVDFKAVDTLVTKLPWYSSRIEPTLSSILSLLES
ncbi:SRP1/TIP1 family protein NDAI_0I03040 [Naumovozyma dairenensis CBS 421]|uniref:Temperature shock-inducible protein 1 n=1 Tax=Naumovozyma dairenensis (strain ATCC 10597 / BCRC 20456 / CBS 421 / NBRC 0211 / NRRL Y-12639) TaxID=1071378 RepID=G0WGG1_NAUDC|nr:hypothetical protein NDAI_0I03040 [Naumovozyma dairenensis CBS 421]CCD26872.1 hypothetical protein NDAI_0I03040 [Naumovozyma dairenensis CBS 421]